MADYRSTGKELRRSPKGLIAACLAVLLLGGGVYGTLKILEKVEPIEIAEESSEPELSVPEVTDVTEEEEHTIFVYDTRFVSEMHKGPLILVNRSTPLPFELDEERVDVYAVKNEYLHVKDTYVSLNKIAMDALNEMAVGFYNDTGNDDLLVLSGFRTREYQQQLYDADLAKTGLDTSTLVAKPGCSEHESGYALDFSLYVDGEFLDFDGTGVYSWVAKHCAEYGFILRYTKAKQSRTEFDPEPWHFRYVGVPHALYMAEHNLCLEEYIDLLAKHPYDGEHLMIPDGDGKLCEVFSVPVDNDAGEAVVEVPVAAELPYTVSGNNRDAFIVTVETGRDYDSATETTAVTDDTTEDSPSTEESTDSVPDAD